MPPSLSRMRQEILESPDALDRLLTEGGPAIRAAADRVRAHDPGLVLTVARGSSDHAATFLKYACELLLARPVASIGPSVASIYGTRLRANGALCLAISQSGQSPDILRLTETLRDSGALAVALTNNAGSDLAGAADAPLAIHAGPEQSVAATKTFIASLAAGLWLLAEVKQDADLRTALHALPEQVAAAVRCDWSAAMAALDAPSLFTLGRGPSLAMADEAALKFKETCLIHAESHSSAEVMHGPISIVEAGFPVLAFAAADAAEQSLAEMSDALAEKGAQVFALTDLVRQAVPLPHIRTGHWLTDPIAAIASFYPAVEALARQRGIDPDVPRHLKKVTRTI